MIDDVDIKDIPIARLRNMLGVVLQDTFIFSGNVAENLKLSTDINKEDLENIYPSASNISNTDKNFYSKGSLE